MEIVKFLLEKGSEVDAKTKVRRGLDVSMLLLLVLLFSCFQHLIIDMFPDSLFCVDWKDSFAHCM